MERLETATRRRAGAAARAKKALSVADHTRVARVLNPVGERRRVAGSSFMVVRNTRAAPVSRPGRTSGIVTLRMDSQRDEPRLSAASSSRGLICNRDERMVPTACGMKRTI